MSEIRNSLWCVHKTLGVGMVGETVPVVTFHPDVGGELAAPEVVQVEDLRPCYASEVPARLEFTPQQLADFGYGAAPSAPPAVPVHEEEATWTSTTS